MASALPLHTTVDHTPRKRTDIVVDDGEPTDVLQALTSGTAQEILAALRNEPGTASNVAETVETSLQNTRYHLERLSQADLIEPVETWYSEKGREMTVYAVTAEEIVIQFGSEESKSFH